MAAYVAARAAHLPAHRAADGSAFGASLATADTRALGATNASAYQATEPPHWTALTAA